MPTYRLVIFALALALFSGTASAQNTPFTISNLTFSGGVNGNYQVTATGSATLTGLATGTVPFTETGTAPYPCGGMITISQTLQFNASDTLTITESFNPNCTSSSFTINTPFNVTGGTGIYGGKGGLGMLSLTIQSSQVNGVGPLSGTGNGSGALTPQLMPVVPPGGIAPVYSHVPTIQSGEWVSIFGTGLATSTKTWNGDFPTSLGGTNVTIDGNLAYLWYVSPSQINLQVPADTKTGPVQAVVTTPSGSFTSTVTLAAIAPSFSLLDATHVTGIILRNGGTSYDILGPTGNSLGYPTVAAKAGDSVVLFAVGLGPTNPPVAPGQLYSSAAATATPVTVLINNVSVTPSFAGLSSAGLYQINLTIPPGLSTGDLSLQASVGGQQTQAGVVMSIQGSAVVNPNLTITTSGAGSGTVGATPQGTSCGTGCMTFAPGQVVTLTPTPNAGSIFAGWSGACSGTGSCSVTLSSSQTVNATFSAAVNPTLTITTLGTGSGTYVSSPPGTSCGSGCLSFASGTAVSLTATAAAGSAFAGWTGACSGAGNCNVQMTSNQTVTAAFNPTGFVSGTAATGAPIANAGVTLKDSAGKVSTATTTATGGYTVNTAGMTPPFLVQVQTAKGNLYSVSADTQTTTTINIHPFTDLIIRSWYAAQGQNMDTAFSNPAAIPAPSAPNVQIINNAITAMAQVWLTNAGVNTQFNPISSAFAANGTGFDVVLAESTVNASSGNVTIAAGGTTQTSTVTYNTAVNTMTIASTTASSSGVSVNLNTTVIPTGSAQQAALNGILTTLTSFFNAVNSNGSQLTAAELTPFMAGDLVHDGLNQGQLAASLATFWRGNTATIPQIETVKSLDLVNGIADVVISNDQSEFWFENVAGTWLIGGDGRIAAINLSAQSDSYYGSQSGSGPQVNIQVLTPHGSVTAVTVTGASAITGLNGTNIMQGAADLQTFQATPTAQLVVNFDSFDALTGFLGNNLVPAGTPFTFVLTRSSGPAVSYTIPSNAFTTDVVSILSPTSGTISSYTLGQPLGVQWTLPKTFPIAIVSVNAVIYTGSEDSPSTQSCGVSGSSYSTAVALANATSGTITIPATCNGLPVLHVSLAVLAKGVNGEIVYGILSIL